MEKLTITSVMAAFRSHILFFLILVLASTGANAMEVNKYISGSWFNPSQDGHGFSIEVLDDDTTVVYWYVYDLQGNPLFLVGIGENVEDQVIADTYIQRGMKFGEFRSADVDQEYWGQLTLTFHDCDRATLEYDSTFVSNAQSYGRGTIPLTKLLSLDGLGCSDNPSAGTYQGAQWDSFSVTNFAPATTWLTPSNVLTSIITDTVETNVLLGTVDFIGDDKIHFEGTRYDIHGGHTQVTGSGEFSEGGIRLSLSDDKELGGNLLAVFRNVTKLDDWVGTYTIEDIELGPSGHVTLHPDGKVSGSTHGGCDIDANWGAWSSELNMILINGNFTNCPHNGWLYLTGHRNSNGNLIMTGADGTFGMSFTLMN